jgi:hypothetical protein
MLRAWGAATDEESRAYLQSRLVAFCKMMFWAYLAILAFLFAMYSTYPWVEPKNQRYIYLEATIALVLLAAIWRIPLLRWTLSHRMLNLIDLVIASGAGLAFGLSAYLAWDLWASSYTCLIYAAYSVFTRALLVPSSGWRTLLVSSASFLPVAIAAAGLWIRGGLEIPGPAFFVGDVLFSGVAVTLAAIGSRIIYGLRRQVTAAQQLGQYTLDRKIGEGGMGAVYRAHHIMLRRPTAVKLLLPDKVGADNLERFEREVQHMSQLTHPNTVAVFDYGRSPDGVFYYAMEYLGGGIDLENLVRARGPQPSGRVIHILAQVCGALQEAHDGKIIHRDIKPANIILCERGGMPDVAKVVDFGLVKEITADTGASTQVILGTPAYVAPEAITDPARIGPPVDLYALGCVGYFMLTGKKVFEGKTAVDVCIQHVTATPKRPSEVGPTPIEPALEAIIMRCLAKKPEDRFASAADLADALRALPAPQDWSEAEAKRWWRAFRVEEPRSAPSSDAPTLTITVDVGERESAA